jgi:hypothetical protein
VLAALRIVAGRSADAARAAGTALGATLEVTDRSQSAPARVEAVAPLEGAATTRRIMIASPADGFSGFLDGIQQTRVLHHIDGIIPVVHATVAAAVRERRDRELRAWGEGARIARVILIPVAMVERGIVAALEGDGFKVIDTAPEPEDAGHPLQLLAVARLGVQQRREALESALATAWCAATEAPLYVDGGIGGLPESARGSQVVGVIKSHRTLYGEPQVARAVAALGVGERSAAFVVSTRRRVSVASWYLRLRDGAGDPLGGLVRVEIAELSFTSARADEVSGWILREREPAALPDPRWRVMAYGIRDCEEYLRAVTA